MPATTRELWDYLTVEADEMAALSAIFEQTESGFALRCASLLVGPAAIANGGWPAWRLSEDHHPTPTQREIDAPGTFLRSTRPERRGTRYPDARRGFRLGALVRRAR